MQSTEMTNKKKPRYSISVPSGVYDRLRAVVAPGSLAGTVDEIIRGVLNDPDIAASLVARCRQGSS